MAASTSIFKLLGDTVPADAETVRFEAVEAVSRPYEVTAEFFTKEASFDVHACLNHRVMLQVVNDRGESRFFDGVVDRGELVRVSGPHLYYRVRLRPALAALAHRVNSRIFQASSIVDVAMKIFKEAGFDDKVVWQLVGTYEPKEFIVQYQESELNFVSRLFEDNGIFYFFKQSQSGHELVISDDPENAFCPQDDAPEVHFTMTQGLMFDGEPLEDFSRTRSLRTTDVRLRDYDFEKPQQKPEAVQTAKDAWPMSRYEYPGGFTKAAEGQQRAKARIREQRRDADVVVGRSTAIGMRCGVPFTVDGAAEKDLNGKFVVTELVSQGIQNREAVARGEKAPVNVEISSTFTGIPGGADYAPERRAHKPRIRGVQTAVVTGPSGAPEQAIHTDKFGRIKVRFYWDRVGQQDDQSSCWIRVAQLPMGGSMILPRVGWEVSVCFLEGDPDRPVVLGRLYNAEKPPPYALPGTKASGSIKSMSSPGAGGFNEIKMADSGGSQGFGVHAQKDLNITIGHDKTEQVGVDEEHNVKVNASDSVGANETVKVGGNQTVDVGANLSHNVTSNQSISVGGNDTSNATANYVEKITGSRAYKIGGNSMTLMNGIRQSVKGDMTRKVGAVEIRASVASIADNILGDLTTKSGAVTVHLVNGSHGEVVTGNKTLTSAAAELHMTKADLNDACDASVTRMIGGLHYQKIAGDYYVKGPMVTLLGAVGVLKGGGSEVKLGGGPVVLKGSKVAMKAPMIVKLGGTLKMGSG